jgi:RHS repeat-associated protein
MMKKLIQLSILLIIVNIYGQDLGGGFDMPQITRPEASVSNLMTFEEIPVSNYTGIPQVNVPLFSLPTRSKDVGLNMFLAYHPAAGVMYNAPAGDCGLGWSLFSGGVISRTLAGLPDEYENGYSDNLSRDIYQFNFFGHTGRFFIDKAANGTLTLKVKDNANSKLTFNLDYNLTTSVINSMTVFDDRGYKYVFENKDIQTFHHHTMNILFTNYIGAWHLTKVFDNNNQELLNFNYNAYTQFAGYGLNNLAFYNTFLKEKEVIAHGYGKISINYSSGASTAYNENIRISNFELLDSNDVVRKRIKMYSDGTKLTTVEALSPDESIKENYAFQYKHEEVVGGNITVDEWGYKRFLPECLYTYPIVNVTEPLLTKYVTNDVLNVMTLPTGGQVKFDYESNTYTKYKKSGNTWVLDNDNLTYSAVENIHSFNYPANYVSTSNVQLENLQVETVQYKSFVGNGDNSFTFTMPSNANPFDYKLHFEVTPYTCIDAYPINPLTLCPFDPNELQYPGFSIISGNGVIIPLSEYNINGENLNKFDFCLGQSLGFIPGQTYTITINAHTNPVKRGFVHITKRTDVPNLSKTIHGAGIRINNISYFDNPQSTTPTKTINYKYNLFNDPNRSSGVVSFTGGIEYINEAMREIMTEPVGYRNVTVYQTGLGRQEFTYKTPIDYDDTPATQRNQITFIDNRSGLLDLSKAYNEAGQLLSENSFSYGYVADVGHIQSYNNPALNHRIGWVKLLSKTSKNYFSNNNFTTPVQTTETFLYDDIIRKVIKHTSTNTLGELVETNTIYHTGNSPFSQNRIAEISEMSITKAGQLIGRSKVNYATNWGTNQSHLPSSFEISKANQASFIKSRISAYDQFSNPTESQQENGTISTYIWGYNKTQVIAQIVNASNAQVATALGVANVHLLTEANLTAINNLRANAAYDQWFITTATYIPLVGVSNIIDPKGDSLTYQYDNMNRLIAVRDRNNHILSESQYHTAINSTDLNFVLNTTYKSATTSSNPTLANQHKVFIDGLGRPIQEIAHQQSNTDQDIISHIEYDDFGRRTKNYLPYASSDSSLDFRIDAKREQRDFYDTPEYEQTSNAYTESRFEASPLQRVLEQAAPGEDWKMTNSVKHTVRYDYLTNETNEVRKFKAVADESTMTASGFFQISLTDLGFYATTDLYKTITKNENWKSGDGDNNTTHQFKNKEGQVVLLRTFGESEVGGISAFSAHDTYYVYDQYGNLTYMIPPKAEGTITPAILNNLCYQYRYDHKNRLVEKKIAGKQWEFLVYDKLDRVVAMGPTLSPFTDATPNTNGWLIAKYDAMNRKIISGWMTGTLTSAGRKGLQTIYDGLLVYNENKNIDLLINGVLQRYTNSVYPTNYHPLTINYFDDYNFPDAPTSFPTVLTQTTFYNNTTNRPKGLATGSWIRVLENQNQARAERSFVLYDNKARAIRTRKTNYLSISATTGYTQVDAQLDFAGKTLVSEIRHKRLSEAERVIREVFTYTAQDRLLRHTHQITTNGIAGPIELLALYGYNELGQMTNKRVGGTNTNNPTGLQKIDYTYNIRGWLTDINNVNNLNNGSDPQDVFAYKMNYNQVQNETGYTGEAQYNGNISETYWRTSSDNTVRKYGYKYDHLNRLKEAIYQRPGHSNPVPGQYDEKLRYDKNGNITYLRRTGQNGTPIDDLTYQYFGSSNRLMVVQDNPITNTPGFESRDPLPQDYFYDTYGNLTKDLNKGIGTSTTDGYTYNHLNQPIRLVKGTSNMQLFYNAAGQKVKKVVLHNGITTTTDYLDGFQYKNNVLEFFGHAEGFVANNSNILKYVFQYKDQVGNVRVSYAANTSGVATILEENHYYPYGLKHAGYGLNTSDQNAAYKYRYNSREYHDELGLDMTAMDFRMYDNVLGRFFGIDALSEQNHYLSTYNFADGNPVIFSDPSGLDSIGGYDPKDVYGNHKDIFRGNNQFVDVVALLAGNSAGGSSGGSDGDKVDGAWQALANEDGTWITFEWITEDIYDSNGNLKEGLFRQALLFIDHGTFDADSNSNMGSATVLAFTEKGCFESFQATTFPADPNSHAVVKEGLYIAKWGTHNGQGPALNLYNTIDGTSRIPIVQEKHPNPKLSHQFDKNLGAYATGINVHWAYPGRNGYTTGFDSRNKACSTGCFLVRGTKQEYQRDFVSILNQKYHLGVILFRSPKVY